MFPCNHGQRQWPNWVRVNAWRVNAAAGLAAMEMAVTFLKWQAWILAPPLVGLGCGVRLDRHSLPGRGHRFRRAKTGRVVLHVIDQWG